MMNRIVLIPLLALGACATQPATKTPGTPPQLPAIATARVTAVNPELQFVVLDFGSHKLSPIGSRLSLYREDQSVGVVQITEPVRGRFATADIVQGDVRVGDEAR
jgi:hypothetical protein